jgi:cell division protease FtsH
MIAFLFGGRAAEELVFKDYTTGASNDIERATDLARRMVCEWGMSEKLGPIHFEKREGHVFLGMSQGSASKEYSEQTAREIDAEISKLVNEGHEKALQILRDNSEILKNLAEALFERETLEGHEIDMIMAGKTLADIDTERASRAKELQEQNQKQEEENKKKEAEELKAQGSQDGAGGVRNPGPVSV